MSINLYPEIVLEGDLTPDNVGTDVDEACKEINEATKGWGTNEERLIMAIAPQGGENRAKIAVKYKEMFGKDLKTVMKKECKGDLGAALQYLAVSPEMAECDMIHEACSGVGTKEKILYPIICGRTNKEITILKAAYFKEYTKDLSVLIAKETRGDFEKILFNCLQGAQEDYDPGYHTEDKAKEDANAIYEAGQGKMGTDEHTIFKILCASPPEYLKMVNMQYVEKHGYTLFKALEKELKRDGEDASLFLLGMKLKPYETVAKLIHESCKGIGTNELLLTCTIIRYQGIMKHVQEAFLELFSETVQDRIKKETKGDYEMLMLQLVDWASAN